MNRITLHHTGGVHTAGAADRAAYHRLVQGDGSVVEGVHPITANAPGKPLAAGRYAAHTRGLNTGNIGVSLCAMGGAVWANPTACKWFPTAVQVNAMVVEVARLARAYGIPVDRRTVLTHAEVEPTLGVAQRGKWDFDYDPSGNRGDRDPIAVGDVLRSHIRDAIRSDAPVRTAQSQRRTLRQGDRGDDVGAVQGALGLIRDGVFGPRTRGAVVAFQAARELLPDGIVGPMTWAALLPAR
jgi:hypothetical protein